MRQSDPDSAKMKYEQAERQERLLRAQAMSDEDRFLAGARLFDLACRTSIAGIRHANPELSEDEALQVLKERLRQTRLREYEKVHERLNK